MKVSQYFESSSVVFVNPQGKLIFQLRDHNPGIVNPGKVTAWGGAMEGDETALEGALREVCEETNLRPKAIDFEFVGEYYRNQYVDGKQMLNHGFFLYNIDETKLEVFEGETYYVVDPTEPLTNPLFTDLTRKLIREYNARRAAA